MASYRQEPLNQLLANTLTLDPLIATRHSQQRCVVRLFQQCFASTRSDLTELQPGFNDPDGVLIWWVSDRSPEDLKLPAWASSVVLVRMERPADLRQLVSYVHAYQTLLNGKVIPEQDWVARREAQERLSHISAKASGASAAASAGGQCICKLWCYTPQQQEVSKQAIAHQQRCFRRFPIRSIGKRHGFQMRCSRAVS